MTDRRAVLLAVAAAALASCSPRPRPRFAIGFLSPVTRRVARAAERRGLEIAAQAPPGAAVVSAAAAGAGGGEVTADWFEIRRRTDLAVAQGAAGIYFRLPATPAGRDYLEYVEESQAVDRVIRELLSLRTILENGAPASVPFAVDAGIAKRAWRCSGRLYVLLVNPSRAPLSVDEAGLEPWRALFAVRADAREALSPCGRGRCLPPGAALWLEGRLGP